MTAGRCAQPIEFETLVAYWLGELPAAAEAAAEEHYFGCAYCARRLERLAALGGGIRAAVREGKVWGFVTPSFVEHMKREGLRWVNSTAKSIEEIATTILQEFKLERRVY